MNNYKVTVKTALMLTYVFMFFLALIVISMPFLVEWYVEVCGKDPNLATTIMLTCYPCVPFAAVALFSIRKLFKNILSGLVFGDANIKLLRNVSYCLYFAGVIMIIMGHKYLPFYVSGIMSACCGLCVTAAKNLFDAALQEKRESELKNVK